MIDRDAASALSGTMREKEELRKHYHETRGQTFFRETGDVIKALIRAIFITIIIFISCLVYVHRDEIPLLQKFNNTVEEKVEDYKKGPDDDYDVMQGTEDMDSPLDNNQDNQ